MSTVIAGDDVTYTASQLVAVNGGTIIRDTITANSTDVFPTATAIITAFLGVVDAQYDGNGFQLAILNESNFTITQTLGVGLTFVPQYTTPSVLISAGETVTFSFVQIDDTGPTMEVYVVSSGTVAGPARAPYGSGTTDNALIRWDGATGGVAQNSVVIIGDTGIITGVLDLTATGTITATGAIQSNTSLIMQDPGAGTNTITLQAPNPLTASYSLTLPDDDGTSGQVLTTDGAGILTWTTNANGDVVGPASATDNAVARFDTTTGKLIQNSVVIIGDTGIVTGVLDLTATGTITATGAIQSNTSLIMQDPGAGTNTITLQAPNPLTASYSLTLPDDDGTSGQVLTTDGAGILTWTSPASGDALFYQYGPAASVAITGTYTTVLIPGVGIIDAGTYTYLTGVVTVATTGVYEIAYWAQFETLNQTGGANASFGCRILRNAGAVAGSIAECFINEQNGNLIRPGAGKTIIVSITAADTIALQVSRTAGTTTGQTRIDGCTLSIMRLR